MTEKLLDLKSRLFMQYNLQEHHDYRVQGDGISGLKVSPDSLEMLKDFVGEGWAVVAVGGSDERGNLSVHIMAEVPNANGTPLNPNDLPFNESETPAVTEQNIVRQYAALTKEEKELDAKLKDVKRRKEEIAPQVETYLIDNGIQNQKVDGMVVFLEHKIYASAGGDVPSACVALKSSGMGQYVSETFNTNSLSAWAREQYQIYQSEHADEIVTLEQFVSTLPPELQSSIKITETVKVKAKKG